MEKTTKMKVVDLRTLWNLIVDNFFIWIRLGSQINNLRSVEYNIWRTKTDRRHMWQCGAVVEGVTHEGDVAGSNPTGHIALYKMPRVVTFWGFLDFYFVECFNLSGVLLALHKAFV